MADNDTQSSPPMGRILLGALLAIVMISQVVVLVEVHELDKRLDITDRSMSHIALQASELIERNGGEPIVIPQPSAAVVQAAPAVSANFTRYLDQSIIYHQAMLAAMGSLVEAFLAKYGGYFKNPSGLKLDIEKYNRAIAEAKPLLDSSNASRQAWQKEEGAASR